MEKKVIQEILNFIKAVKDSGFPPPPIHNFSKKLGTSQMQILDFLMRHHEEEINQKDLEKMMGLRKSTISSLLDTMEKNNIIYRTVSTTDGRKKIIKVKEEHLPSKESVLKHFEQLENTLTRNISQEKLEIFFEVLDIMKTNLKEGKDYVETI